MPSTTQETTSSSASHFQANNETQNLPGVTAISNRKLPLPMDRVAKLVVFTASNCSMGDVVTSLLSSLGVNADDDA